MYKMTVNLNEIKNQRKIKGYTQQKMSSLLGHSDRAWYAKRENGFVSISADDLIDIAQILGFDKNSLGIFFTATVHKKEREEITL